VGLVAGTAISGVVGAVAYFLSLGFPLPPGTEGFKFFAVFGVVCGLAVGNVVAKRGKSYAPIKFGLLVIADLVIGFIAALVYMLLIGTGVNAGATLFVILAMLLAVTFFCLGFALPLAGISFTRG
jgi:hypothetical protein